MKTIAAKQIKINYRISLWADLIYTRYVESIIRADEKFRQKKFYSIRCCCVGPFKILTILTSRIEFSCFSRLEQQQQQHLKVSLAQKNRKFTTKRGWAGSKLKIISGPSFGQSNERLNYNCKVRLTSKPQPHIGIVSL